MNVAKHESTSNTNKTNCCFSPLCENREMFELLFEVFHFVETSKQLLKKNRIKMFLYSFRLILMEFFL